MLVRGASWLGVALAAFAGGGCGTSAETEWNGPPAAQADGTVAIDAFAAYQSSVEEDWERSTVLVASKFLDLGDRVATNKSIRSSPDAGAGGAETVEIVLDGVEDELVRAERWTMSLEPSDTAYRLVAARLARSCQHGSGHERFSAEPCEKPDR